MTEHENHPSLLSEWREPPAVAVREEPRTNRRWGALSAQLRERPGEWAELVPGLPPRTAHAISHALYADFRPGGSFEAVTRDGVVYARYRGALS